MSAGYYIHGIDGPIVRIRGGRDLPRLSLVYVGERRLFGEVVSASGGESVAQIYEDAQGLKAGEPVYPTYEPLSIELGPGLLGGVFDGVGRPLKKLEALTGSFIASGVKMPTLDAERRFDVKLCVEQGQSVTPGMVFATCEETGAIEHRAMVPEGVSGTVEFVAKADSYTVEDVLLKVQMQNGEVRELGLRTRWPVRRARPTGKSLPVDRPLITGQRVIDSLFPIAKGGCAAVPGPFGAGKTVVQHQLAKWSDADIVVYLGCGERGNEMTQVLMEFAELKDPRSGRPLMERTILIANTSNMPIAAREASVYTGMSIAEYYRDMGYDVALMADSTSRWAEALREMSGRLEELPADEGFPSYLPTRLGQFYERAGIVETLGGATGSVTVIGAVSPQGGDFSEPVTQSTQRFVRTFWALDRSLAYARHFPSIDWNRSYSEYYGELADWYYENFGSDFELLRRRTLELLHEESALLDIVKLLGYDVLPEEQKLIIETGRLLREGFLQQNAFHKSDAYMLPENQGILLRMIVYLYDEAVSVVSEGIPLRFMTQTGIFTKFARLKFNADTSDFTEDALRAAIDEAVASVRLEEGM